MEPSSRDPGRRATSRRRERPPALARRDDLPAPAGPTTTPRYRDVAWTLAGGSVVTLAAFTVVAWDGSRFDGGPTPMAAWVVLVLGIVGTVALGIRILALSARAARRAETVSDQEARISTWRQRSRAVAGQLREALVITDGRGTVQTWNDAAQRIVGADPADAIGKSCDTVMGLRSDAGPLRCTGGCALLTNARDDLVRDVEVLRDRDGTTQSLLVNVAAVVDERGEPTEVVHLLRDISRIREADEAKTVFLATTSHELRTPITVIGGFAEMLTERDLPPEQERAALDAIRERVDQLAKIVDRLLLTSRLERGRVDATPSLTEIRRVVASRVDEMRATVDREIQLEAADALPAAWVDESALATILEHLVDNAVKYSPAGEPVEVRLVGSDDELRLEVCDRGIGMGAEEAARCFERFWQAEQGDTRRFGGTGIGLYLVRSLVEAMDARIEVDSTPGEGSVFRVRLRTSPPVEVRTEPPARPTVGDGSLVDELLRHTGTTPTSPDADDRRSAEANT